MTDEVSVAAAPERVECPHCSVSVPPGSYCGNCGAHLAAHAEEHRMRGWAFAAAPHEHVFQLSFISTLFPHLPHRHSHAFRRALVLGAGGVMVLAVLHLYAAATLAAALLLPILYLLYLFDVEVYEHEPVLVIGATFVLGALLGGASTWIATHLLAGGGLEGVTARTVLLGGVVAPLVALAFMVAGPLVLLNRRHFNESLDGLAFATTSAMGYSMVAMLVVFWPTIIATPLNADPLDWGVRIIRQGFFVITVNAGTVAAIAVSLWLLRHGRNRERHSRWYRTLPMVALAAVVLQVGLGVASVLINDLLTLVVVWGAAAAAALLYLRLVIHHALLEEGSGDFVIGPDSVCIECHHVVPAMLFCPHCGVSRSAAPKHPELEAATETPPAADTGGEAAAESPA